jgi:hypothetical protein
VLVQIGELGRAERMLGRLILVQPEHIEARLARAPARGVTLD